MNEITSETIRVFAPAKINLALHLVGKRQDGYHLLESLVTFANVGDQISVTIDATVRQDQLEIIGPFASSLEASPDNLVLQAVSKIRNQAPGKLPNFKITLEKNLPIASGIGGGSADAAATLLGIKKLCFLDVDLAAIGLDLGADVPMCINSMPLIAKGIGNEIETLADFPELNLLLVNPNKPVSTKEIFSKLQNVDNSMLSPLSKNLTNENLIGWLQQQRNDLEPIAASLEPTTVEVTKTLKESGALLSRMSGSGATCFGIYKDDVTCKAAGLQISEIHPDWWVVPTITKRFGKNRIS